MQSILTVLAALAGGSGSADADLPRYEYCIRGSLEKSAPELEACEKLAAQLLEVEKDLLKKQNAVSLALDDCAAASKNFRRGRNEDEVDRFLSLLEAAEKGTAVDVAAADNAGDAASNVLNYCDRKSSDAGGFMSDAALDASMAIVAAGKEPGATQQVVNAGKDAEKAVKPVLAAREAYEKAVQTASTSRAKFADASSRFAVWQRSSGIGVDDGLSQHKQFARLNSDPSGTETQDSIPARCNPSSIDTSANSVQYYSRCRELAIDAATPATGWQGMKPYARPASWDISQSLKTAKSGSNVELLFSGQIGTATSDGSDSRQPRNTTFSFGVEASIEEGLGVIAGRNSDDGELFGLDRLNSDLILKSSIGWNYFARQSAPQFEQSKADFLKAARAACLKSIKDGTTYVRTNCRDNNFVVWLYETDTKSYLRKDLIEKYDALVWRSSESLPRFGGGFKGSIGLRSSKFHLFSDDDRNFDPTLVDEDAFFSKGGSALAGKIDNKVSYTIGGYTYLHLPNKRARVLNGTTLFARFTYKSDLEEGLTDKKVEICRADIASVPGSASGVYDNAKRCKKALPFKPEFKGTLVPEVEARMRIRPFSFLPETGIAPKVSYAMVDGENNDLWRFEMPWFFTLDSGSLSGGIGYAYEYDFSENKGDRGSDIFFIFIGKKFSLDGSKPW